MLFFLKSYEGVLKENNLLWVGLEDLRHNVSMQKV